MRHRLLPVFCVVRALLAQPSPSAVSAEDVAKSNNPFSDVQGFNFTDYYSPTLFAVPDAVSNAFNLRGVMVAGPHIIRLTIPVLISPAGRSALALPGVGSLPVGLPVGAVRYQSGLGDINIFDMIRLTSGSAKTIVAAGPLLVAPSATNSALGSGKWQAGFATGLVHPIPGGSLTGFLLTWQHDFAGDKDRPGTNLGTLQPMMTFAIGNGYFVKSSPVWTLDFRNDRYHFPVGLGVGKVLKAGNAMINASLESQFTVYKKGDGLPAFQLAFGLSFQWNKSGR